MPPPITISDLRKSVAAPASELQQDPRWQLIERILLTGPFQKSANLHALLSYLSRCSIQGKTAALTERQIGLTVFAKSADYTPAEDSSVRVHVRQLRLRLHEYFAQEGRNETLRVDIPKGSYALEFAESQPAVSPPSPAASAIVPPPALAPPRRSRARDFLFWAAIAAAIVCAAGWYRSVKSPARPSAPWPLNAVLQPNRVTRVIVSDANLSSLRFFDPREITLEQYLQPGFRDSLVPSHLDENFTSMMTYLSRSELTSFADVAVATDLVKLAGSNGDQLVLTAARDLDRRDLEKGNYIFVGSPTSNPWVALFADKLNFQVVEDGVGGRMYFRNKNPRPGEQPLYEGLAHTGSSGEDFATIALLPGSNGQGNVLILQGLRQEGTEALGVLLADPSNRAQLAKALGISGTATTSPHFEALVRTHAVAGAPVSADIVATRILPH